MIVVQEQVTLSLVRSYKMTYTYTVIKDELNRESIQRTDPDGKVWSIPIDESNSDYQAYLATLASELSNPSTPQAGE